MKMPAVSSLLAFAIAITGCGAAEEPVADTESEVGLEIVAEAEVTEVAEIAEIEEAVEDVVDTGQLPDSWPDGLRLPEGMIVTTVTADQNGYPRLITQFSEDAEPIALADIYNYYCGQAVDSDWSIPLPEQNDSTLTATCFHLDLFHPEYMYVQIDGSCNAETDFISVELTWIN